MSDAIQPQPQPVNDKSKFIRTYAKDVAALAGGRGGEQQKPNIPAAPPVVAPPPPPPKPVPPPVVAPQPPQPPQPSAAEIERRATMDRLRQKVQVSRTLPQPPVIAPPPPPVQMPPPPPVIAPKVEEKVSPIHTYKSDFADRIDQKGATTFSVLAAEQDAKPTPTPTTKKSNTLLLLTAVILIVLGGGGLGTAAWYVMHNNVLPRSPSSAPSLVFADEQVQLTGTGPELMSELAALANEPLPEGNVLVVYISESTTTAEGQTIETPRAGGALIKAMQLPAPNILLRNVSEKSTVGIVNAGGETRPFFVFGVTSYERTFAGMLVWERSMVRDLATLYPARGAGGLAPSATSATIGTSTPVFTEAARPEGSFVDAVVANHDVRILRDTAGQSLILYGYVGKGLLILARDEAAYAALLGRLSDKE